MKILIFSCLMLLSSTFRELSKTVSKFQQYLFVLAQLKHTILESIFRHDK